MGDLGDIPVALASESVLKDSLKIARAVNWRKRHGEQMGHYSQELKLMVNQSGGLETGASLGKCISCSQMWSSYFSSNKGDLKAGPAPDVTQGLGVWSLTKQDFQCCYTFCPSPSGFASGAS